MSTIKTKAATDKYRDEFAKRGWYTVLTPTGDFFTGPLDNVIKMLLEKLPIEGRMQ